jgi:hypothetical protein
MRCFVKSASKRKTFCLFRESSPRPYVGEPMFYLAVPGPSSSIFYLLLSHFSLRGRLYFKPRLSSPVHQQMRSTPDGVRDPCSERRKYGSDVQLPLIAGFFNMPQSCDMGQTALPPLRRNGGFEPANLGTRGQQAYH